MRVQMDGDVERFRAALAVDTLGTVDAIRAIVSASHSGLTEGIKWNAPNFALGGNDRITLGLERGGGVRVVLHRGAKPQPLDGFSFNDGDGLAKWPSPDRGVVIFANKADVERRAGLLRGLCSRWLAITN